MKYIFGTHKIQIATKAKHLANVLLFTENKDGNLEFLLVEYRLLISFHKVT